MQLNLNLFFFWNFQQVPGNNDRNASTPSGGSVQRSRSIETEDDEGTELKIIEPRRPVQFITRATFDIAQTPVDSTIEFPFRDHQKDEKATSKLAINGSDASSALPFTTYNSVRVLGNPSSTSNAASTQGKVIVPSMYQVMPVTWSSSNLAMGECCFLFFFKFFLELSNLILPRSYSVTLMVFLESKTFF